MRAFFIFFSCLVLKASFTYAGFKIQRQPASTFSQIELDCSTRALKIVDLKTRVENGNLPIEKVDTPKVFSLIELSHEKDPEKTNNAALFLGLASLFFGLLFVLASLPFFSMFWFLPLLLTPACVISSLIAGVISISEKRGHFKKGIIGLFAGLIGVGLYALGFKLLH